MCTCVHVCFYVLFCSVWDALTDNYISTWDGPASEGLNGNLSEQEVHATPHLSIWFRFDQCAIRPIEQFLISKLSSVF